MTYTQKNVVAIGTAFGVMLLAATAAYAIPIPLLREVLADHLPAMGIWTLTTSAGWLAARLIYRQLPGPPLGLENPS